MEVSPKALAITAVVLILTMMMALMSCGTRSKKKVSFKQKNVANFSNDSASMFKNKTNDNLFVEKESETPNEHFPRSQKSPSTNEQKRSAQLYKRLENSYAMYSRQNYESALNEVESVLRNLHRDPYLEAQAWAMSAMIYDKMHKNSRRKRAYRKMTKCIENLQKDQRYTNIYKEGVENSNLFGKIKELGGNLGDDE